MDDSQTWTAVDDYFTEELVRQDQALTETAAGDLRTTAPGIAVSPPQGKLLALIAEMIGARRALEFGTLAGYSTLWLARAVGPGGRVVSLELQEQNAAVARENLAAAGVGDRVEVRVGPATETAARLVAEAGDPFDLVFIDADKPNNPAYLEAALALTRPGSVIVLDNVTRQGRVADPATDAPDAVGVRTALRAIAEDPRLDATALQTVGVKGWDGFALVYRRS
ncbi:MAG TPA: O-methyltransferase [Candidatus Ruania gallistercoris]|uniref:O-methyltransferase n=1 Tax=Candidatus Ruania gallistercoris TaxID=2838746 RepID=A0A9D2EES1_9MICO|nr:O-methyltransferase [Candidatus Ruania gallistercoris]